MNKLHKAQVVCILQKKLFQYYLAVFFVRACVCVMTTMQSKLLQFVFKGQTLKINLVNFLSHLQLIKMNKSKFLVAHQCNNFGNLQILFLWARLFESRLSLIHD